MRLSITLTDDEYRDLWCAAAHRHIAGRSMVQTAIVQFAFAYLAKYALEPARKAELEKRYRDTLPDARAVQPDAIQGKSEGASA